METSISVYIIGMIAGTLLYITGDKYDKHLALFSLAFIQVQLAEFFMWYDEDCTKGINHMATIFIYFIFVLQCTAIIIGAIIFKTTTIKNEVLYGIYILYIFVLLTMAYLYGDHRLENKCSKKKENHPFLLWDMDVGIVYSLYFMILLIFCFMKDFNKVIILVLVSGSLLLHSLYNVKTYIREFESIWCMRNVSLPIILLLYNLFKKYM